MNTWAVSSAFACWALLRQKEKQRLFLRCGVELLHFWVTIYK